MQCYQVVVYVLTCCAMQCIQLVVYSTITWFMQQSATDSPVLLSEEIRSPVRPQRTSVLDNNYTLHKESGVIQLQSPDVRESTFIISSFLFYICCVLETPIS